MIRAPQDNGEVGKPRQRDGCLYTGALTAGEKRES
jgi:hypothetical protein